MSKSSAATKSGSDQAKGFKVVRPPLSVVRKTILSTNGLYKSYKKGKLEAVSYTHLTLPTILLV